ncbi:hypothetical protein KCU95_g18379, partial [Aureobasidium melanogenum]
MSDKTYKLPTPAPLQHMQQQSQQQIRQATSQQQTLLPPNANSDRALQDYLTQLALLDQQNKKRSLMNQQWDDERRAQMRQNHGLNRSQYFQMQLNSMEQQNKERLRMHREQREKTNGGTRKDSKL